MYCEDATHATPEGRDPSSLRDTGVFQLLNTITAQLDKLMKEMIRLGDRANSRSAGADAK